MEVRPLTAEDIPQVVPLVWLLHNEAKLWHLGWSHTKVEMTCAMAISDSDKFCHVAVEDGSVVGVMAGMVQPLLFSHDRIGVEELLFVLPTVKGRARVASRLVRQFVSWCRSFGVVDVRTGVISNIDNMAVDTFYRGQGFKRIGTIYALREPGGE